MSVNFFDKVRERAYFKYIARKSLNIPDDALEDWDQAFREQVIEEKIEQEAYYNYLNGYKDPVLNWEFAKRDINDRLRFLAFYQHESNINKSSTENWVNAQKIYIHNF